MAPPQRPGPGGQQQPLIVVEADPDRYARFRAFLAASGWTVVAGHLPRDAGNTVQTVDAANTVHAVVVHSAEDAAAAVLLALRGVGVLVAAKADRDVIDTLIDDLRRIGPAEHHLPDTPMPLQLVIAQDQLALLRLIASGLSMRAAATQLNVSERTADRRLADTRRRLGVTTTAAAVRAATEQRLL
jgi:DNA-binding NarL/FixJ family response regulator